MRYIAVARVSSNQQVENTSIGHQLETIDRYANDQLYEKVGEYTDQDSRTSYLEREGLQAALKDIRERKADAIIFYDTSRIGIDVAIRMFIEDLYHAGGKLGIATDGKVYATKDDAIERTMVTGFTSTYEYMQIQRRTNSGKRRAAALGGYLGKPPFGYRLETVVVQGTKVKKPVIDDLEASIVHEVLEALIAGEGRYTLSSRLNQKYKGLLKTKFNYNFIKRIEGHLPKYVGGTEVRTVKVAGDDLELRVEFPRIISDETHNRVKKALHFAAKNNTKPNQQTTPFRRLIYCTCGEFCTNGGRRYGQVSLTCNSYHKYHYKKSQGTLTGDEVYCRHTINHRAVRTKVIEFIRSDFDNLLDRLSDANEKLMTMLNIRGKKLKELEKEIEKTKAALLQADPDTLQYVAATFNEKLAALEKQRFELAAKVKENEEDIERLGRFFGNTYTENLEDLMEKAISLMEADEWEEANSLLYDLGLLITLDCNKTTLPPGTDKKTTPVPINVGLDYFRVIERPQLDDTVDYRPRLQVNSALMCQKVNNKVLPFLVGSYD